MRAGVTPVGIIGGAGVLDDEAAAAAAITPADVPVVVLDVARLHEAKRLAAAATAKTCAALGFIGMDKLRRKGRAIGRNPPMEYSEDTPPATLATNPPLPPNGSRRTSVPFRPVGGSAALNAL